jgi:hypothetical protein
MVDAYAHLGAPLFGVPTVQKMIGFKENFRTIFQALRGLP